MEELYLVKRNWYCWLCCISLFVLIACNEKSDNPNFNNCSCLDFALYQEVADSTKYQWFPNGWMGAINSITCDVKCNESPHSGSSSIKITYDPNNSVKWAGIFWLNNNMWNGPGVNVYSTYQTCDTCNIKVTFWCHGEMGGEKMQFKVGGVTDGGDSMNQPVETSWLTLTNSWSKYEIDITGKDLSNLVGGFCWVIDNSHNSTTEIITIYIDDIIYEATN